MNTYTAYATMRDRTTRPVQVVATCAVEARRLMFALSRSIASLTGPRLAGEPSGQRCEYMRRHGDEEK